MRFVDSVFGSREPTAPLPCYSVSDAELFAKPFIGKAGITEGLIFGELAKTGRSRVLSVGFLVQAPEFRDFAKRLTVAISVTNNPLMARKKAFEEKWGYLKPEYLQALPGREAFGQDSPLNIYVLPLGWRQDILRPNYAAPLRAYLREDDNKRFFEDLKTVLIVTT